MTVLMGAAVVICSGLYTFYRESRRAIDTAKKAVTPTAGG